MNNLEKPIGLTDCIDIIDETFHRLSRPGWAVDPTHFIIELDPQNGRSALTEYVSESLRISGGFQFNSLDCFIEFKLDGTMEQLNDIFNAKLPLHADFSNDYDGVVAMDITQLAVQQSSDHVDYFLNRVSELSKSSLFIFFVPSTRKSEFLARSVDKLTHRIKKKLNEKVLHLYAEPYTREELTRIAEKALGDIEIELSGGKKMDEAIAEQLAQRRITASKDAYNLGLELSKLADFSKFRSVLHASAVKAIGSENTMNVSEVSLNGK